MRATRGFYQKTYCNLALSEAEAEAQKQNEAIAHWCATKNSVLLSDRADSVSDSHIYSLSEARLLGESSIASSIALLSRVYGSDAMREAAQRGAQEAQEKASTSPPTNPRAPQEPGGSQ